MRVRWFLGSESGAATVEWVMMSAAVVAVAIAAAATTGGGANSLAENVGQALGGAEVAGAGGGSESGDYEWSAHDGDSNHWWTNQELRTERYASLSDDRLNSHWSRHVREFEQAVAAGDNSACHGCKGAGNRLDSLYITHQERQSRGLATAEDAQALSRMRQTYDETFGG